MAAHGVNTAFTSTTCLARLRARTPHGRPAASRPRGRLSTAATRAQALISELGYAIDVEAARRYDREKIRYASRDPHAHCRRIGTRRSGATSLRLPDLRWNLGDLHGHCSSCSGPDFILDNRLDGPCAAGSRVAAIEPVTGRPRRPRCCQTRTIAG